jgi:hypothetical protein
MALMILSALIGPMTPVSIQYMTRMPGRLQPKWTAPNRGTRFAARTPAVLNQIVPLAGGAADGRFTPER